MRIRDLITLVSMIVAVLVLTCMSMQYSRKEEKAQDSFEQTCEENFASENEQSGEQTQASVVVAKVMIVNQKTGIDEEDFADEVPQCANDSRHGFAGRLIIPDLGINVACFNSKSQSTVDREDSAALFKKGEATIIGDHKNQGFDALYNATVGLKAYIVTPNGRTQYICTSVFDGHNTGKELTDNNYNTIYKHNKGGIILYTCKDTWKNVQVCFFQKAE